MPGQEHQVNKIYDLLIKNGHLLDLSSGKDGRWDVAFTSGKVTRVAPAIEENLANEVIDANGLYVSPGWIDLHTHLYWGVCALGVDVTPLWRKSGVTTWVDAGSAGAITLPGFQRFIAEPSPINILAFLNIANQGLIDLSVAGEYEDLRWCNLERTLNAIETCRNLVVGVKVRAGRNGVREAGIEPVQIAREAADAAGVPMMVHIDLPPPTLREILPLLRAGDILTHVYRGPVCSILTREGKIRPDLIEARERGVLLDVGHGKGSLDFNVARQAMEQGVLPDSISTDLHARNLDGPVFDLATTLSKFLNLGLSIQQVIAAATKGPAKSIHKESELGNLEVGSPGNATIFSLRQG